MAYKRTSKKTGGSTRTTKTVNTNGTYTTSNSVGNKYLRTTQSINSKTGLKVTQTWRDGGGFTHTKTIYRSPTEAQRRREARRGAELWRGIFGKKNSKKNTKDSGSLTVFAMIVLGIIVISLWK